MTTQMMSNVDGEERFSTLLNNAGAIRAICSAVEGTLGPKGLDTMLVGQRGEVIITNDGVTILDKMDVSHPAARLLVQVARSQQSQVGDGTTTATVLAGALVNEGVAQIIRGVPAAKVVQGMQDALKLAMESLQHRSRVINGLDDPILEQISYIAGRENRDIAELVVKAAQTIGSAQMLDPTFSFASMVVAHEKADNEVWPGLVVYKKPVNAQIEIKQRGLHILVLQDALEPESVEEETLGTDAGFHAYLELKKQFSGYLEKLASLNVGLIVVDRGIDEEAEQFCADHGIMLLQRVLRSDQLRICEHSGAVPIKRITLRKSEKDLAAYLGKAEQVTYVERLEQVRIAAINGKPMVTILVGASTSEVVGERARIAKDAASAVQAAVRSGYLPGGGAIEIAVAHELDRYKETVKGMEGFGVAAVANALRKPLSQIVLNAGFNPLEKVEEVKAAQLSNDSDSIGINCDNGSLMDCIEQGIIDPTLVKIHALKAAGEVAGAVLRIHSVIKMRQLDSSDEG